MIKNISELLQAINQIHFEGYLLCKQSFGRYFPNAGNIGIFCQSDEEYQLLTSMREELTMPSNNPNQKYFELYKPITIEPTNDLPETIYTHLYIRKPDPSEYGKHSGDIDFAVNEEEYSKLIELVRNNEISGAHLYEQKGVGTMIEMESKEVKALSYISTSEMTVKIRVRY